MADVQPIMPEHVDARAQVPTVELARRVMPPKPSPIIPSSGVAGKPLFLVVTAMCYLASITLGASLLISNKINEWTSDVSNEITVQIRPMRGINSETQVADAISILNNTAGVTRSEPMSREDSFALLEPWLGSAHLLDDLPIPRLIAIEIDLKNPPNLPELSARIEAEVSGATIDDHRRWQIGLARMASSMQLIAAAVIALVGATTIAVIVFATRAVIAGNREVIQVLHLTGATEGFVAYHVQKRFFFLGLISGTIAGILAVLTFLVLNTISGAVAAGSVTGEPLNLMVGMLSLPISGYGLFATVAVGAAILGVLTSRYVVMSVLRSLA